MVRRLWSALPAAVKRYIMIIATIEDGEVELSPYLFERDKMDANPRKLDLFILQGQSPFNDVDEGV